MDEVYLGAGQLELVIHHEGTNIVRFTIRRTGKGSNGTIFAWHSWLLILWSCISYILILTDSNIELHWIIIGTILSCLLLWLLSQRTIESEELLVIRDVGVQLQVKYCSGRVTHQLIHKEHLDAVIINEGITMCQVIYYLAFVPKKQENKKQQMILGYSHFFPRIDLLQRIYPEIHRVLELD